MLLYIGKILKFLLPSKSDDVNPVDIGKLKEAIHTYKVGSFLNTAYGKATSKEMWQEIIKVIQDEALNATTHIPVIFGLDSIHGAGYIREATLFPQPLGMAASFNLDIAKKVGEITAMEVKHFCFYFDYLKSS